jgi:hypothetical protein
MLIVHEGRPATLHDMHRIPVFDQDVASPDLDVQHWFVNCVDFNAQKAILAPCCLGRHAAPLSQANQPVTSGHHSSRPAADSRSL